MGDLPKPPDDAAWTEVERTFFAGAPPEASEPAGEPPRLADVFPVLAPKRPRRAVLARLRPLAASAWRGATAGWRGASAGWRGTTAAWRGTARALGTASARGWRQARAGAASLIAALSILRIDRRRVGFAFLGVVTGLSVGIVAFRTAASAKVATAQMEAPASAAPAAQATPLAAVAQATPVGGSAFGAAPQPRVRPSWEHRARRADDSNRRTHLQRKPAPASSLPKRSLMAASEDRETYWARAGKSAPAPASGSFFSR
jgi:hypothetical protein